MRAQDIVPDDINDVELGGIRVRKGSLAAFLASAAEFQNPAITGEARAAVLRDIEEALPALRALDLFDALEIRSPELRAFVEAR